jgi:phage major head subunit gpT-like protein
MCGVDINRNALFVTVTVEDFVPPDHPPHDLFCLVRQRLSCIFRNRSRMYDSDYPVCMELDGSGQSAGQSG